MADNELKLDDIKQRIGQCLGEHLGPRFQVIGSANVITVRDCWAPGPDWTLTIAAKTQI